jgi:mono/diheme cytochrome c family protein
MRPHLLLAGALLTLPFIGVPAASPQQPAPVGADEFRIFCAICHGKDARGDGPLAKILPPI